MTDIYPVDAEQHKLAYNVLVILMLLGTAVTGHWVGWFPFGVAVVLSGAVIWDMYLRPWLYPASDLPPEAYIDKYLAAWVEKQDEKSKMMVVKHERQITELVKQLNELKGKQ